jgi:hypothetical protein
MASRIPEGPRPESGRGPFPWRKRTHKRPLCRRIFLFPLTALMGVKGFAMRIVLVALLVAGSLVSFEARAQERAADAAIGAVSGAVVLGPVGAVAGAIVGFTAGPAISRSWSTRGSSPRARAQRTSQAAAAPEPPTTGSVPTPPSRPSPPQPSPPPVGAPMASNKMPPVQGLE